VNALSQRWPTSRSPGLSWLIAPDFALNWQDTQKEQFSISIPFYCILWHFPIVTLLPTGRSRVTKKFSSRSQSKTSLPPLPYHINVRTARWAFLCIPPLMLSTRLGNSWSRVNVSVCGRKKHPEMPVFFHWVSRTRTYEAKREILFFFGKTLTMYFCFIVRCTKKSSPRFKLLRKTKAPWLLLLVLVIITAVEMTWETLWE